MAEIFAFRPYRYSVEAGPIENLVTQPYDKITHEMRERYLALSPYNLVRVILGPRYPHDDETNNTYSRAARYLNGWIEHGILTREARPCLFAYFQEFLLPDTGERLVRKGFIGLGAVEDYSQGVVHRHEQTLTGPKKDRLELLRHTRAHFGQIFMLYPDPACEIDALLDSATAGEPQAEVRDEVGAVNRIWRIAEPETIAAVREKMRPLKLLIADGHHRYETALAFRRENPETPGAAKVMMTFVNMHSPGLRTLAAHRLLANLEGFDAARFLKRAGESFRIEEVSSADALQAALSEQHPGTIRIGVVINAMEGGWLLETPRPEGALDINVLHERLVHGALDVSEEAVREERHLSYVRGFHVAVDGVREGAAQIGFLIEPPPVEQVARLAFTGGVMPQKSTDFFPKMLSGLTIYRVDEE